jgi:DNA (cytosine-5)-methyltransferase 1
MAVVAVDLFCGCGGVTYGLAKAGIRVTLGTDIDEACRLTFKLNNPSSKFLNADLRILPAESLLIQGRPTAVGDYLLVAACAPCQPFSAQNRLRREAPGRTMLGHVGRIVQTLKPDFLFLENVPGIQKVPGFSAFRRLLRTLSALRYAVEFRTVDASWYGVPQSRRRLVLVGSLYGCVPWPPRTHGPTPGLLALATVRRAISRFPPLKAGESHPTVPNHAAAHLTASNLQRILATPVDGGGRTDWPPSLGLSCHAKHLGHPDVYGRLSWDRAAPTLTTKCTSLSNGRYGHPEQNRAISAREAAALQGFDDSYVFYGGLRQVSKQIGNAVPPALAASFGAAFLKAAEDLNGKRKRTRWRTVAARLARSESLPRQPAL